MYYKENGNSIGHWRFVNDRCEGNVTLGYLLKAEGTLFGRQQEGMADIERQIMKHGAVRVSVK